MLTLFLFIQVTLDQYLSGNGLTKFPLGGNVLLATLTEADTGKKRSEIPILGLYQPVETNTAKVVAFGDASCLDSALKQTPSCLWLLDNILQYKFR